MNAIGYMRLSSKDQSKSLEYQESSIREYCKKNKLNVTALFQDNGECSDSFDRPDYIALEAFIKKYKGQCQYLIVMDHDRFSRNPPEALMKIAELEKKHGVKVLSTTERVDLDTSDPDVFMKRALDYLMANKELFNIRKRTKQGIRNAKENGRYLGRAPFGYKNIIDGSKKNLIEINKQQALIVERIFHEYLLGVPPYLIYKNAKAVGFTYTGSSGVYEILKNCLYAGLIKVPAYKELPEKYVKGIHEPIVSENEFWLVQSMLKEGKRRTRIQPAEDFPLRGVLKCWCGQSMTAGWSKGCRKYYLYYRCLTHTNINIPGNVLHDKFEQVLKGLSFQQHQINFLLSTLNSMLVEPMKLKKERQDVKIKKLQEINQKIFKLEEKFMNDEIESSTYQTWFKKLKEEKAILEYALNGKEKSKIKKSGDIIERLLPNLANLYEIYDKGNVSQKHTLIRAVFKDNLFWGEGVLRTKFVDLTFQDNLLKINEKGLLFNEQPFRKSDINLIRTQKQIRTATPLQAPPPQGGASTNFATWV